MAFLNGVEYRNSVFKCLVGDDLSTLFVNLVNVGPVTSEFKRDKDQHPLVDRRFGNVRFAALLLAAISTEFCGAVSSTSLVSVIH